MGGNGMGMVGNCKDTGAATGATCGETTELGSCRTGGELTKGEGLRQGSGVCIMGVSLGAEVCVSDAAMGRPVRSRITGLVVVVAVVRTFGLLDFLMGN